MLKDLIEQRVKKLSIEEKKKEDKLPTMKDDIEMVVTKNGKVINEKEKK